MTTNAGKFTYITLYLETVYSLFISVVATKLLSKAANDAVDFELSLQEEIVASWTRNCLERKRTDCVTPP